MATTNGFEPNHRAGPPEELERTGWTVGRITTVVGFLAIALFWAWAFSPLASRTNPDSLEDETLRVSLEAICADARQEIDQVPNARAAADMLARADQIATVSRHLDAMVTELEGAIPRDDLSRDGDDGELLTEWLGDWRTYLGDRDRHEALLRDGQDVRFSVTAVEANQITDRIDQFATFINGMPSCATPLDL